MLKATFLCIFVALGLSAQQAAAPDQLGFHFLNPVPREKPDVSLMVSGSATTPLAGSLDFLQWNYAQRSWQSATVPEWGSSRVCVDFAPGNTVNFSADPRGSYKMIIGWEQADGHHQLTIYWLPSGVNGMVGDQDEFDFIGNILLGPAQELVSVYPEDEVPFMGTVQLGGVAPPYGSYFSFAFYQDGAVQTSLQADKGKYSIVEGSLTCDEEVTIDFSLVGAPNGMDATRPIFVGVRSGNVQLDQLLVMPFARPFDGQCQPQ